MTRLVTPLLKTASVKDISDMTAVDDFTEIDDFDGLDVFTTAGQRSLLRIATAGSVDDGKSTLIGRLLYDTKTLMDDQLKAVVSASKRRGDGYTNLALLTDGLRAEREQGITIDVAYRFFATPARSFIVADTPGHAQYTRNMVTGASTSDVAIVLVDARNGIVEQSRRHGYICASLGVAHIIVAVNKMDLVGWDEAVFASIAKQFRDDLAGLGHDVAVTAIPISALLGDNVVDRSTNLDWYNGPSLLELLETIDLDAAAPSGEARLSVQWVIRPIAHEYHDYRGYTGQLAGGTICTGDPVVVWPSGQRSTIAAIDTFDGELAEAHAGAAITLRLTDNLDISRGDVIAVDSERAPLVGTELEADVCWMTDRPATPGARYLIKLGTNTAKVLVDELVQRVDVKSLEPHRSPEQLELNDLARIRLRAASPLVGDSYRNNHDTGRFILIDPATNATAAAGMIRTLS
jgi:sulfate adenylyltransferase subunit 1